MPLRRWRKLRGGAFAGEGQAGVGIDETGGLAGLKLGAFAGGIVEGFGVAELTIDLMNDGQTGQGERFAGGEGGAEARVPRDDGLAGEIAGPNVFGQGEGDRSGRWLRWGGAGAFTLSP